ncbi:hypothetical protein Rumeso_01898 [Rubellimicrobium mesophilum DSM 19309]|uniref:Uncharacterized protein n=1 Tax=Rubellimicrobium mesophilum DSM 19309 TaxID=442562 RepID=A0A017HPR3_9RHOB|nr:hypothetical protein Rumeso_01898 [Rubellimicrobium mesophilum DSM 19309]
MSPRRARARAHRAGGPDSAPGPVSAGTPPTGRRNTLPGQLPLWHQPLTPGVLRRPTPQRTPRSPFVNPTPAPWTARTGASLRRALPPAPDHPRPQGHASGCRPDGRRRGGLHPRTLAQGRSAALRGSRPTVRPGAACGTLLSRSRKGTSGLGLHGPCSLRDQACRRPTGRCPCPSRDAAGRRKDPAAACRSTPSAPWTGNPGAALGYDRGAHAPAASVTARAGRRRHASPRGRPPRLSPSAATGHNSIVHDGSA